MKISVAYASEKGEQAWVELEVAEGTCVEEAIEASGLLQRFSEIDLSQQAVGIYGRLVKLDQTLNEWDRIEIYRPITADPKTVPRRQTEASA